jgi:hypothetical protein
MLRFRSVRTRSLLFALATLVVIALGVLLAWGWGHYQDGLQSKRATVVEINNRIKTLGKKASVSTDQAQRQKSLAEAHRLLVERRELEKELRPLFQRFLDAFR